MLEFAPLDLLNSPNLITSALSLHFPFLWSHFWWSHFQWALPVGYFHVPLTWFSIHFCACSIHFCGSTHVCAVRFIFRPFRLMLVQLDLFLCVSPYLYAVRFIFVRFDSFVYGSIYVCARSIQFLCRSIHFLGRSIYFWVVRFIFCCFDILWAIFALFVCVSYCSFCSLKILSVTERHREQKSVYLAHGESSRWVF